MAKLHNIYRLRDQRKQLRLNQTPEEKILWWYLKGNRLGYKFRRQHSVENYILDFYCAEKRLIVEVDGGVHLTSQSMEHDAIRDKFFADLDYKTLRFSNTDIRQNINEVIAKIKSHL